MYREKYVIFVNLHEFSEIYNFDIQNPVQFKCEHPLSNFSNFYLLYQFFILIHSLGR